jgi:hypothetical protein
MGGLDGIEVHAEEEWTFFTAGVRGVKRADWLRRLESMQGSAMLAIAIRNFLVRRGAG